MGLVHCFRTQRSLHLLLLLLLFLSSTTVKYSVEGKSLFRLRLEAARERGEEKSTARGLIGSRPPACERRCVKCGHCEAVQVPVVPQEKKSRTRQFMGMANLRGDYSSNYKPLSWKCKCGDMIFNP